MKSISTENWANKSSTFGPRPADCSRRKALAIVKPDPESQEVAEEVDLPSFADLWECR